VNAPADVRRSTALVVGPEPWREHVVAELTAGCNDVLVPVAAADAEEARAALAADPDAEVAFVALIAGDAPVVETLASLVADGRVRAAPTLLVTDRDVHDDVSTAFDDDLLDGVLTAPWTPGTLAEHVRSQLARWLRAVHPDAPGLAVLDAERTPFEAPASELLRDLELDELTVAHRLLAAIERALGPRPVLRLAEGTRLTHQDRPVNGVFVVRSGSVGLYRDTAVGELRLHHASTGPIVGILSLAQRQRAYFTARATTEVEVVHLTLEQLDLALQLEPEVGAAMAATSVRALAARLRRSEQLQVERIQLNRELEEEQRRLSQALEALESARLELVEQARMATLGELSAGVAHELNNPVAALTRAASYVAEDVDRLLATHPAGAHARAVLRAARDRPASSSADDRSARRTIAEVVGDEGLARRLVAAGITDPEQAAAVAAQDATGLEVTERAASLGTAVRNLEVAGRRVAELVDSLRSYARPDTRPVDGIDLHELLDDTLRLVAHNLQGIDVERYFGDVPTLRGHPGQLSQVWTNLIVNAADAMQGRGRLTITTDQPDPDHVRVRIVDDGPGIAPDVLPRLFEPRFTTKHGQVRYGLGLGLPIAKRIVDAHGGRIEVDSEPGRTEATVLIPVAGPPPEPGSPRRPGEHDPGEHEEDVR
jgi:two-component system, NtrC family, sensor kinase